MFATAISRIQADGVNVFYRHAGAEDAPVVLLLHGFPSSSHMFRNLIPHLATRYRVIAPDLPGFGFTTVPAERNYKYTFENLTQTITAFVDFLGHKRYAIYIFDYGAPTGLRLALSRPKAIAAIVTQNGNAYTDGFGHPFWDPIEKLWKTGAQADRDALRSALTLPVTKFQYVDGSKHPDEIPPETYYLDQALLDREGNQEVQLDLLYDYRTNLELYPTFQEYFRTSDVPVLAAWGKNDTIFIAPGAEAYKRDVKKLELKWLDAGHFALETNEKKMAEWMFDFFDKHGVF